MNAFWAIVNSFTQTEMWVYGLAMAVITVVFGHWISQRINHALATIRDKRKNFATASQKLIEAFTPAIARLDAAILHSSKHERPDVNGFLRDNFQAHASAIGEFGRHVFSKRQLRKYQEAWKEYCCLCPNEGHAYMIAAQCSSDEKAFEFIQQKIENIMQFAKPKL